MKGKTDNLKSVTVLQAVAVTAVVVAAFSGAMTFNHNETFLRDA
jgi:hypothetical protein